MPVQPKRKVRVGDDGKFMSDWQVWLYRLCIVLLVWAAIEALIGMASLIGAPFISQEFQDDSVDMFVRTLGVSSLVGAGFNIVGALLGIRGARNPQKITLFFWVAFTNATICSWELASSISNGALDPASVISCLFTIALGVCVWNVRGQTGYFDNHPYPEDEQDQPEAE